MGIEKNGQLYWTFQEVMDEYELTNDQARLFVRVHKDHMNAFGTENKKKFALANVKKVIWDQEENCIKVYYENDWWHYSINKYNETIWW